MMRAFITAGRRRWASAVTNEEPFEKWMSYYENMCVYFFSGELEFDAPPASTCARVVCGVGVRGVGAG